MKQLIETQASQSSAKASSFVYVFKYARCSLVVVEHMGTKNRITINIHVPFSIYGNHSAWQCLRHVYCAWKLCQQRWPSGHGTDFDHSHHLCSRKFAYWVHSLFYPHKTNQLLKKIAGTEPMNWNKTECKQLASSSSETKRAKYNFVNEGLWLVWARAFFFLHIIMHKITQLLHYKKSV